MTILCRAAVLFSAVSAAVALRISTSVGYPSVVRAGVVSNSVVGPVKARPLAGFGPRAGARTGSVQLQMCIGKVRKPLPVDDSGVRRDSDTSWQTVTNPAVVPVHRDRFASRPQLLSFDAFDTLIQPSQSVGRWYREALNDVCDMRIRLPRPALFADSFKVAYKNMCEQHPCFGATTGLSSRDWWFQVVQETYRGTRCLTDDDSSLLKDELEQLLPEVFEQLYDKVFATAEGWIVKEDALYTLTKLAEWRNIGAGPKLAVISNFDERLHNILAELDLRKYFDLVLTSRECGSEKPQPDIFHTAMRQLDLSVDKEEDSIDKTCFHIGNSLETDVVGAVSAGWTALRFNEWFDDDFPDWTAVESAADADKGFNTRKEIMEWGRKEQGRKISVRPYTKPDGKVVGMEGTVELEWVEMWGLDDILTMFGFPVDTNKPIRTTVLRGFLED